MAQTPQPPTRSPRRRVRGTWGLLLLTGIGIITAVTLVCMVPLYSEVAQAYPALS